MSLTVSFWMKSFNLSGKVDRSFFFLFPIKLVQSYVPQPLLSAFRFSQIEKVTPRELIVVTSFLKWNPLWIPLDLHQSSSSSHSIASSIKLSNRMSVTRGSKINEVRQGWCGPEVHLKEAGEHNHNFDLHSCLPFPLFLEIGGCCSILLALTCHPFNNKARKQK